MGSFEQFRMHHLVTAIDILSNARRTDIEETDEEFAKKNKLIASHETELLNDKFKKELEDQDNINGID